MQDRIYSILTHLSQRLNENKDLFYDAQEIWDDLSERGFTQEELDHTLHYIEITVLASPGPFWSHQVPSYRYYSIEEKQYILPDAQAFLWNLKSQGVIDHALEDEVIQKAHSLDKPADKQDIKKLTALTIFAYEYRDYLDVEHYLTKGKLPN